MELSCPVIGPDDFVMSALQQQVGKHREREQTRTHVTDAAQVIVAMFEYFNLDPDLAWKRVKPKPVSRARALSAWLWVEKMGRPQVMVADAMGVRRPAISKMLAQLRREGLNSENSKAVDTVFRMLVTDANDDNYPQTQCENTKQVMEPTVFALKRNRIK